MEGAIV
jgi:hypothetical protein